jgi:hypothetical protein
MSEILPESIAAAAASLILCLPAQLSDCRTVDGAVWPACGVSVSHGWVIVAFAITGRAETALCTLAWPAVKRCDAESSWLLTS